MGNVETVNKEYTSEQLKQTEKQDISLLTGFNEKNLFDDSYLTQKYLSELESNTSQYQQDNEKLKKLKKEKEKFSNTESALSCVEHEIANTFKQKELKWLKNQLINQSIPGTSSFSAVMELRLVVLQRIQLALIRREKRHKLAQFLLPEDKSVQQKAEFVMSLYQSGSSEGNTKNNGKIVDEVLSRLNEVPNLFSFLWEEEEKVDDSSIATKLKQDKMDIDTEQKKLEEELITDDRKYEENFSNSLVSFLLAAVVQETRDQLESLRPDSPLPDVQSNSAPSMSPSQRLLQYLQRDIIFKASCSVDPSSKSLMKLLCYSKLVIQHAIELLDLAFKVNSSCFGGNPSSMVVDNLKDSAGSLVPLDFRVQCVLRESMCAHLLHLLSTSLSLFMTRSNDRFVADLLPLLSALLTVLDQLAYSSNDARAAEINYQEKLKFGSRLQTPVEVESPHNYYPNTDEEKNVHIPGCTHLYVTFDPQCSTDQGQDFLQLYRQPNKMEPILTPFSGKSDNWPKVPIIVPGDQVFFYFHSDPFMTYWGYRCLVTGLNLDSSNVWIYDLERTVGWLLRRCMKTALVGHSTEQEKEHEQLLDSQLFRGGIQESTESEATFVENFIENKEGTLAHSLLSYMEKNKVVSNPTIDRIGGQPVSIAIRAFMITLIKHLGMLPAVMQSERTEETEQQLCKIWNEGKKLRTWIGAERRRILLEQEASKEEEEGVKSTKGQSESSDTSSSYEYLSNVIINKMRFLLRLSPASSYVSSFEIPADTFTELKARKRGRTNLRASQESSLQSWKELFTTWRAVQHNMGSHKGKKESKHEDSIPEVISLFIKKGISVDSVQSLLACRVARALTRTIALSTCHDILTTIRFNSVKQDISSIVGSSIRSLQDSESSGHYLCNVKGSTLTSESTLRKAFFRLYNTFVFLLKDADSDAILRRIAIEALCIGYRPEDHEFLLHVLPPLHRNQLDSEDTKLQSQSHLGFRYLALQCVGGVREQNSTMEICHLDPMQKFLLELIFTDLDKCFEVLKHRKLEVTTRTDADPRSYHKEEKFMYDTLLLFHIVTQPPAYESFLTSTKVVQLLLKIHHVGTPRAQRLSLRMLRHILPTMTPSTLNDLHLDKEFVIPSDMSIVDYFLDIVGDALFMGSDTISSSPPPTQDYRTGKVTFAQAASLVMLLRLLLCSNSWNTVISSSLHRSLTRVPSLLNTRSETVRDYKAALAALCVIGGHTDTMRAGGRVEIKSTKEKGTLVEYDRQSSLCKVIIDTNVKKVIECDADKLQAIPEVPFDPSKFPLVPSLIPAFTAFTVTPRTSVDTTAMESSQETKEMEMEKEPEEEMWSCSVCTLNNKPNATICGVCGASKPKGKSSASSEPVSTSWFCSVCTLENEPMAGSCVVCGSPKAPAPGDQMTSSGHTMAIDTEEKPKDEEMKDVPEETSMNVDLLFHSMRSKALKALSVLLQHRESATCLFNEGGLAVLVKYGIMAVCPTELGEFRSVEQLEYKEGRLWELIYQLQHSITEDTMQKQLSQVEVLKHSPFAKLPVILPNVLDRGSGKRVTFPASSDLTIVARGKVSFEDEFGLVRGNNVIPNSLPTYYFEVTLLKSSVVSAGGLRVALGLYREGTELEGLPGNSNSYAYQGDRGQLCHNVGSLRSSRVVERDYGPSFGVGDVIGCGWNIKTSTVWFTKNGEWLGNGFEKVAGRFYPCIWIGIGEVQLSVNFGQHPFAYNFAKLLPPEFLSSLTDMEKTTKGMGVAEIRRRTQAEELKVMMDIFPLELCIIALEKCKDDMQYGMFSVFPHLRLPAANWLIENGFKELERMSNEIISKTSREGKEKEEQDMMNAIMEEQRALGQFIDQDTNTSSQNSVANAGEEKYTEEDEEEKEEEEEDEEDDYEFDSREPVSRYLDEELGVEAPVQIERSPRYVSSSGEDMKIEDVLPGMLLSVFQDDGIDIIRTVGKTGVITEVDLNSLRIKLRFFDSETSSLHSFWFLFQSLKRPANMYQDPCVELKGATLTKLKITLSEIETALSTLRVRRTVLHLISEWPGFPFEELCKSTTLCDLLKLAASEYLSSGIEVGKNESNAILTAFRTKLGTMIAKEENVPAPTLKIPKRTQSKKSEEKDIIVAERDTAIVSLTKTLTEECIKHFISAVDAPLPILIEESAHPYENNQEVRQKYHIKGASKLLIRFDANCNVHRNDPLTRCSFYRDEEYQDLIVTYRGAFGSTQSLIIDSDKVFFRFTSGAGETFWGYKFTIVPLSLRLNDHEALRGLNFELGYWLLELLLENVPLQVKRLYIVDLYEALVYYIATSKRSAKARGIQLLLKIMQELQVTGVSQVDLSPVLKLRPIMERKYRTELNDDRPLFSAHLQGLVELLSSTKLTESTMLQQQQQQQLFDDTRPFNLLDLRRRKLRITKAKYGVLGNSKWCITITDKMQQVIDRQFGGSCMVLSGKHSSIPWLQGCDPAPGKEKKLSVTYDIVEVLTGRVVQTLHETASEGDTLVLRTDSWFEDVTNLTEFSRSVACGGQFSHSILLDTWAMDKIGRDYYWGIADELTLTPDTGLGFTQPCAAFATWTISLWMVLEESTSSLGHTRTLLYKGYDADSVRNPALFYDYEKKTLQLQVSTTRDWLESYQSTKEIPLNTLVHIVCWCDGKTLKLYLEPFIGGSLGVRFIDGKLDGEKNLKGRVIRSSDPFYINKVPNGVQNADSVLDGAKGTLRNIRVYMRALNDTEIQVLTDSSTLKDSVTAPFMIEWKEFTNVMQQNSKWTLPMSDQLTELVTTIADEADRDLFSIDVTHIHPSPEMLSRFVLINQVPLPLLQFRFAAIRAFNLKLSSIFSLVDFTQAHLPWSLANAVTALKGILFMQTKLQLWNKILSSTTSNKGRLGVTLSRPRALKAKEKGDPEGKYSVFGQLYRQLHFVPPSHLRKTGQVWSVVFSGEGGQDAGGLFRDSISHACSDLQSPYVPLFIPCPNSRGFGDNQEKWVPNPAASSSLQLSMYSFVGKLMGVAIRGKHVLNLDLPSIVWKQLVGSEITRSDLEAIDAFSYKIFDQVQNAEKQEGINSENFAEFIELTFTTTSTDGREIELIEGGKNIQVNWDNRREYVALMEKYRLNEFRVQVDAIKSGLATIVPIQLLSLFTPQELELTVCGKREVNVELLKQNTKYSGYQKTDAAVDNFWQVIDKFSTKEKELFLRFVWGRSRLPLTSEDFEQKFVLMTSPENTDHALPVSHTCFFQLELPRYSSMEIMRKKLLYAITECREIDTDHAAQNIDWDNEGQEE